jgi:hypothetical protein
MFALFLLLKVQKNSLFRYFGEGGIKKHPVISF